MRGGQSSSGCAGSEIITEHGQDVKMFINDQHGQIIIITVVVEGATGQHLRSKCQSAFNSKIIQSISTAPAVSRELKTAGLTLVFKPCSETWKERQLASYNKSSRRGWRLSPGH